MDGAVVVPSMSFLQRLDPRQWFAIESGYDGTGEFSFTPNFSLDGLPDGAIWLQRQRRLWVMISLRGQCYIIGYT